ncbi:MAG TPA: DUF2007 domain-containing protein [Thermoflexia bacterium]|nr:DUF2007 domain-containing protein [Thermoflexia bacterium]
MRDDLTVIYVAQGLTRAHVVKGYLEEHGLPVVLQYESAGPAIGITLDGLGEVRLLVPTRLARWARRLLLRQRRRLPYWRHRRTVRKRWMRRLS